MLLKTNLKSMDLNETIMYKIFAPKNPKKSKYAQMINSLSVSFSFFLHR